MPPKNAAIVEVSVVPAPRCESCGTRMIPASDHKWKCEQLSCGGRGAHVYVSGVYPMRTVEKGKAFHAIRTRLKATLDDKTCSACCADHGHIMEAPHPACTSEHGCRCVAEKDE